MSVWPSISYKADLLLKISRNIKAICRGQCWLDLHVLMGFLLYIQYVQIKECIIIHTLYISLICDCDYRILHMLHSKKR